MKRYTKLPAIRGRQLIKLLVKDGWIIEGRVTHGVALSKRFNDRTIVTVIPDIYAPLDEGTLGAILGSKQTCIGKVGLLIQTH